jgi:C2 domain
MDKNHDGSVSIAEFIRVFLEAVEVLNSKIEYTLKSLTDFKASKEQVVLKLNEARRTQRKNSFGVCEGSTLTVVVVEAMGLQVLGGAPSGSFVIVQYENERSQTNQVEQEENPVWNQTLQL